MPTKLYSYTLGVTTFTPGKSPADLAVRTQKEEARKQREITQREIKELRQKQLLLEEQISKMSPSKSAQASNTKKLLQTILQGR